MIFTVSETSSIRSLPVFVGTDTTGVPAHVAIVEDLLSLQVTHPRTFTTEPSTSALSTASQDELRLIAALFDMNDRVAVEDFVRQHSAVIELLVESLAYVARFFGYAARPTLEIVSDPGTPQDQELFVVVSWGGDPAIGLEALRRFDRAWWLSASTRSHNALNFTVRYG